MSRIQSWDTNTRNDFLAWVGKSKQTAITFLDAPLVRLSVGGVDVIYTVEPAGMGFVLRDQYDNTPPLVEQETVEPVEPSLDHIDPSLNWTQWASGPQRTLDEMLTDICAEFVCETDWPAFRREFEEAAFILADEKVRHFASEFLADTNPTACLWAMAFAGNWSCVQGRTQTDIAQQLGITRAALSKRIKQLAHKYGQRSHYSRSHSATAAYSEREKLKQ